MPGQLAQPLQRGRRPCANARSNHPRAHATTRHRCLPYRAGRCREARRRSPEHQPPVSACRRSPDRRGSTWSRATRETRVPGTPRVVTRSADQSRAGDEKPITHGGGRRMLAGHLCLPVLLSISLIEVRCVQHRRRFVRADGGVRRETFAARRTSSAAPLAEGSEASERSPPPRRLDPRIPLAIAHAVVRLRMVPVSGDKDRARGDRPALASRQTRHGMPAPKTLQGDLATEPCRTTQREAPRRESTTRKWPGSRSHSDTTTIGRARVRGDTPRGSDRVRPKRRRRVRPVHLSPLKEGESGKTVQP